jgi:ribonuclease T2
MRVFPCRLAILALLAALLPFGAPATAQDRAGDFDYFLLSLSWTPSWCRAEGDARAEARCAPGEDWDFGLHGLWPQHEAGWPEYCETRHRNPSRTETEAMTDIMGSSGLAWHQWNKHGRCTGLSAPDYFALTRQALASLTMPAVFDLIDRDLRVPPDVVEEAFREVNPAFGPDSVIVTCRDGRIEEMRICLTRDGLRPRDCGEDVLRRTCRMAQADLPAPR